MSGLFLIRDEMSPIDRDQDGWHRADDMRYVETVVAGAVLINACPDRKLRVKQRGLRKTRPPSERLVGTRLR
jgi:hypothetical protein